MPKQRVMRVIVPETVTSKAGGTIPAGTRGTLVRVGGLMTSVRLDTGQVMLVPYGKWRVELESGEQAAAA